MSLPVLLFLWVDINNSFSPMPRGLCGTFSLGSKTKDDNRIRGLTSCVTHLLSWLKSVISHFKKLQPSTCLLRTPVPTTNMAPSSHCCLPLLSGLLAGFTYGLGQQKWAFWEGLARQSFQWFYWTLFSFQVMPGRTLTRNLWVSQRQRCQLHRHSFRKAPTWPIVCSGSWTSILTVVTAKPFLVFLPPNGALPPTLILETKDHSF